MNFPEFPKALRKLAFKYVMNLILAVFPSDIGKTLRLNPVFFDKDQYVPSQIMNTRIMAIKAIGPFFRTLEGNKDNLMHYFDTLFAAILHPSTNILLHIAVMNVINQNFAFTNKNRLRIENIYRSLINNLFSAKVSETASLATEKFPPLVTLLFSKISKFNSQWYTRPSDQMLARIVASGEQFARLGDGYSKRRWQFLLGDKKASESNEPRQKLAMLKRGFRQPYSNNSAAELDPLEFEYGYKALRKKMAVGGTRLLISQKTNL